MKHLEDKKHSFLSVSSGNETLSLMLHILLELYKAPLTTAGSKVSFHVFFFLRSKPHMSAVSKAQSHHMTTTVIENKISPGRGLEF